jgi:hypothetical protein
LYFHASMTMTAFGEGSGKLLRPIDLDRPRKPPPLGRAHINGAQMNASSAFTHGTTTMSKTLEECWRDSGQSGSLNDSLTRPTTPPLRNGMARGSPALSRRQVHWTLRTAATHSPVHLREPRTAHDGVVAPRPTSPDSETVTHAAETLRRLLAAVQRGEMVASTPQDVALVRRLQGALTALEAVAGGHGPRAEPTG